MGKALQMTASCQLKIVAAIPCFNEERFIGSVVAKTRKQVDEVIVIDDGSTDESAEVARAAGATVYRHGGNRGYGAAVNSALESGRSHGADILVVLDADGQHDPKYIPQLTRPIFDGQADVVVGSRFLSKDNKAPFYRQIGQRILNFATNLQSQQKISDSQSGYRAYSSKALEHLSLSESGMSVSSEILFRAREAGLRVEEIPVDVRYGEKAKRSPVGHGLNVLTRIIVWFALRRPLTVFGLPGLACLVAGLVLGIRAINAYIQSGGVAVGHVLIAILLGTGGFLGLFGALMLQTMKEVVRREIAQLMDRLGRKDTE